MAKFLAQLLHLEDSMVAKDNVDEGGEGGGEARVVDEARVVGEATIPEVHHQAGLPQEVHHQAGLPQEASQVVLHHEGEGDEEGEGTQTAVASSRTSRVSPQPRWWPTSSSTLDTCVWCSTARTVKPYYGQNCPGPP